VKERTTRGLVVCVGWLALTTVSILALPFSSASATTLTPQNSGHCLSVIQGTAPTELQDGARIEQRACDGASRQNWTLEDMGSSRFRAKVLSSNKCLEPVEDIVVNGTELEQRTCDGTSKQLWTREPTTLEGTYRFRHVDSTRCLDVPQRSTVEGVHIIVWDCHLDVRPQQSWAIAQRAIATHSQRCLDVLGGPQEKDDDAPIDQWQCNDNAWNQFWTLRDLGNNQVKLVAQNSGKCIQPRGGAVDNLTQLVQMTCSDTATAQLWSLQSTAILGEYKLVHALSSKCIDIKQSLTTDGAEALLFTCKTTNQANQIFKIGTPTSTPPPPPTLEQPILSGEYWGLPTRYPAKSPYGGLHQIFGNAVRWSSTTDMVYVGGFWRDLNENETDYNRARVENGEGAFYGLNEIAAHGKTAIIWINAIGYHENRDVVHSPDWLLTKCGSSQVVEIPNGSKPWGVSMWNDCPRTEMVKFIKTMFTPYRDHPALKYAYVTTFNAGEFFIPNDIYTWAAANAGLTPQKLETYAKALIDAWIEALGADKVVWMRANDAWKLPVSDPFLADTPSRVNQYALITKGVQMREGNAENFMANLIQPLIGQDVEPTPFDDAVTPGGQRHWYLKAKTIHDMLPTLRTFYGEEFEIAGSAGAPWFENPTGVEPGRPIDFRAGNYPYYRLAVLNMLRKGQNWAVFPRDVREGQFDQDPGFLEYIPLRNYFRQSAGYRVNESPDAWVTLHETHQGGGCFNNRRHYHNYDKFLHQREQPGGMTKPAEPWTWDDDAVAFPRCLPSDTTPSDTNFAKRTDWASGNQYIYFDVDDAFATTNEHRFRIAVTYQDRGTSSWQLEYSTPTSAVVATPFVTNTDSKGVKTAIFSLSDASFRNAQTGGMDFRIWNRGNQADVIIRSVRVLRGGP
jgi:hypothetical protein